MRNLSHTGARNPCTATAKLAELDEKMGPMRKVLADSLHSSLGDLWSQLEASFLEIMPAMDSLASDSELAVRVAERVAPMQPKAVQLSQVASNKVVQAAAAILGRCFGLFVGTVHVRRAVANSTFTVADVVTLTKERHFRARSPFGFRPEVLV